MGRIKEAIASGELDDGVNGILDESLIRLEPAVLEYCKLHGDPETVINRMIMDTLVSIHSESDDGDLVIYDKDEHHPDDCSNPYCEPCGNANMNWG